MTKQVPLKIRHRRSHSQQGVRSRAQDHQAAVRDHSRDRVRSQQGVHREARSPQDARSRAQDRSPDRDIRQKIFWKMKIWILWI